MSILPPIRRRTGIVIVEDEPDLASYLTWLLEYAMPGHGRPVAHHATVRGALEHDRWPTTALALLDWHLPDGTAQRIIRHLTDHHPHVHPIVLTADVTLPSRLYPDPGGVEIHLKGTLNTPTLLASIRRHLT